MASALTVRMGVQLASAGLMRASWRQRVVGWSECVPRAPNTKPIRLMAGWTRQEEVQDRPRAAVDVFSRTLEGNKRRYYMDLKQDRDTGLLSAKLSEVSSVSRKRTSVLFGSLQDLEAFVACLERSVPLPEEADTDPSGGDVNLKTSGNPFAMLKAISHPKKTYSFSVLQNGFGKYLEVREEFRAPDGVDKVSKIFVNPRSLPALVEGLKQVLEAGTTRKPRPTLG